MGDKEKTLDTLLIGLIEPGENITRFFPSPEFQEAGKFKMLRDILKEKGSIEYSDFYS